jgi:hypothetical protein
VIDVKLWVIQDDINLFVQLGLQVVEIVLDAKFIVHRYVKLLTTSSSTMYKQYSSLLMVDCREFFNKIL